ncbi:MAG TPA: glycine cleavage system protein GcvH [Euryarchaeota archaeon]|nr:glycine cleavage system protein GcvH [Euryarchaeota archaeon]
MTSLNLFIPSGGFATQGIFTLSEVPDDLKYVDTHEWIRIKDNIAVIGITDFAQEELHEVVYVELPEAGRSVEKGEEFAAVESVKARSEIYAPISGKIAKVNVELVGNDEPAKPELINEDPYGSGWLVEIEITDPSELEELISAEQYRKTIEQS